MANKIAPYRNSKILEEVQRWFDDSTAHLAYKEHERPLPNLYIAYVHQIVDRTYSDPLMIHTDEYRSIVSYEDFAKCLYALGIIDITDGAEHPVYRQMERWRPSLDQLRRLQA